MLKAFALWVLHGIIGLALMGFLVLMVAEWAAGCGETYTDSKGIKHQNECIFIKR
jgi:succinate dehydrogenase/fumarate reductase cytochrome b subunit